jgi:hypothetical protein
MERKEKYRKIIDGAGALRRKDKRKMPSWKEEL